MRKAVLVFAVVVVMFLIAADFKTQHTTASLQVAAPPKKPCYGYTIIEFGKGIDCNGDTIALVKVNGGQAIKRAVVTAEVSVGD